VGWDDSGSTRIKPGIRKVAGETEPWALMPPQPEPPRATAGQTIAATQIFELNRTAEV
jgi:hypothetical protein